MSYGTQITLEEPFADTVARVRAALAGQGFGVLTEIDVTATLQAKLGEQMEDYVILGACNPPFAHQALGSRPQHRAAAAVQRRRPRRRATAPSWRRSTRRSWSR